MTRASVSRVSALQSPPRCACCSARRTGRSSGCCVRVLGWREFDGKLQAAGWITQQGTQPWVGAMTLYVDDPTLAIPRNQFRSEQVRLGRARFDLKAEPDGTARHAWR